VRTAGAAVGVAGFHIQPTRISSSPRGHGGGFARAQERLMGLARGGTMDTSRRPDGPIDSRIDRQVRPLQSLQLMTWMLSWILKSAAELDTSPSASIGSDDTMAITSMSRSVPRRRGRWTPDGGWRRPPAWRLGASGGRRRRHPEPTDRGLGTVPHAQPGPTPGLTIRSIPSCPPWPSSRAAARQADVAIRLRSICTPLRTP
jgi:hypothetical protein